jgi:cytochrome b6
MTFYYRPTVAEAFASVQYIMTEVNFGWLIRSIHRWSASMMVLMMILHVFRVYLTGCDPFQWNKTLGGFSL